VIDKKLSALVGVSSAAPAWCFHQPITALNTKNRGWSKDQATSEKKSKGLFTAYSMAVSEYLRLRV